MVTQCTGLNQRDGFDQVAIESLFSSFIVKRGHKTPRFLYKRIFSENLKLVSNLMNTDSEKII
jgi:hypothetical protein